MSTWIKKDLKYIWHPFTQMKDCRKHPPILIKKAKGLKLYDQAGRMYYDTISSWWCNIHGHNHPRIQAAIQKQIKQLDHVLFAGFTHRPAIQLSEKLVAITPKNLTKVFFSDNGSTAVEVALKMSLQYWHNIGQSEKIRFIFLDHGYHGDTIGAMSVSGRSIFNQVFSPLLTRNYKISSPYCYRCPVFKQYPGCDIACIGHLEKILREKNKQICGLILEPFVMAAGGMIIYPKEYLARAFALCKKYNVHFIVDEVATGFGRTGKMFACDHVNIQPDFMCLSKGITSGTLPLAVTLTTKKIYQAFYADYAKKKTFYHGHTYTANPLACSAALASLDIFEDDKTFEKIKSVMHKFHQELEQFHSLPCVGDVRCIGMIGALELVKNKKTRQPFSFEQRIGFTIYQKGLTQGLILRPLGNVIYLYLPLCVNENEMRLIFKKLYTILGDNSF